MKYEQSLQELLKGIERCESIMQISKTVDPVHTMNEVIKSLSVENWKVGITDKYMWSIKSSDSGGTGIYEQLGTNSFEDFRNSLVASITEHLKKAETRSYDHIKDFREKAVVPAIAVIHNLTEDIYKDAVFRYQNSTDHEEIVAGVERRKQKLYSYLTSVAEEWTRENIAAGLRVSCYPEVLVVDRVITIGGSVLITFKDSETTSDNFKGIDFVETWLLNVKGAKDIYTRIENLSY